MEPQYITCFTDCRLHLTRLEQVYSAEIYREHRADAVYYLDGCASKIHDDEGIFYPKGFWPVDDARQLAQEVVDVLRPRLLHHHRGRIFVRDLEAGRTEAGCSLNFEMDQIFIQLHRLENPLQLVATVIHELAHVTACDIGHLDTRMCGDHCIVWLEAARILTSAFIGCMRERSREPASGLVDMLAYQTRLGGWFRRLPITQSVCIDCRAYRDAEERLGAQEEQGSALGTTNEVTWNQLGEMSRRHAETMSILQARAAYSLLQEGAELITESHLGLTD